MHSTRSQIAIAPFFTKLADRFYNFLQRLDKSHRFAKLDKRQSKTFLRCTQKIERDAIRYAARHGYDIVCCGQFVRGNDSSRDGGTGSSRVTFSGASSV